MRNRFETKVSSMENKAIARIEQFAKKISESLWNESGTGRAVLTAGENSHFKVSA
ncbi:hypothetical protein [Selenomonas ruminantium]|uniref:hypothetical protein n=1 Tax=Selenomonas ruminantium TaxID=971 RepID=UPI0026E92036|nr:hypothetical protein [Selenomonas ruminantium]